ncbi:unnamed protein product [Pedinophyceae sp. YPF-701]|nr:unnamed protein product [Pedinophyceae sp. YPF-701]
MDRLFMALLVVPLMLYCMLSFVLALALTLLYVPRKILISRLYWAVPFIPAIWSRQRGVTTFLTRSAFEMTYSINALRRLLTAPIRSLPSFYIIGFPKAGTTSIASQLRRHPAIRGLSALPYGVMQKESHFFSGVFGARCAHQSLLYRSFFPTLLSKFWVEVVRGAGKMITFDATPTYAVLPHVARRVKALTPDAKLVVCVRNPCEAVFSAEVMLRNLGMDLPYTMMDSMRPNDARFAPCEDETRLWQELEDLDVRGELPQSLPELFYTRVGTLLRAGNIAECLRPWLAEFTRDRIMVVDYNAIVADEEGVVRQILEFVGADPGLYKWKHLPPGMKTEYRGRRMHPTVAAHLRRHFEPLNRQFSMLVGRNFAWTVAADV